MLDWEDLRHFAALAREGSLSAAARVIGVDHATVARRVAALEAATGLKLVDRRARAYALTDDGRRIAAIAARMEESAFAAERAAQASSLRLRGAVSISAPPAYSSAMIAPRLIELKRRHPGILITLIGEKRSASLQRREADLALRLSRPTEPGLVARKIASIGFGLYGAPDYLKATPAHAWSFIAYDSSMNDTPQQKWLMSLAGDNEIALRTSNLGNQVIAAQTGLGVAVLPRFVGDISAGLERRQIAPATVGRDVWLVVHRDLRRSAVIRSVMEFLVECVKAG
ncbi:LysR family transcriptional regulator [Rhodopseudomonas sp. B29]|uniref:LysR family transcriptional regulator n=1 Tax=Rhodopseudomonas sp. B29 TaxID=95607 RepID=UPI00034D4E39|nr:LysR family transcriptional regulator [Rhodopseudomonas sp. B29]